MLTDPLHATIEADMRAAQKLLAKHKGRRAAVFDLPTSKGGGRGRLLEVGVISIFDYNTVEAVLLACAILVNLAGIMFDSSRFAGVNAALYMWVSTPAMNLSSRSNGDVFQE